MHPVWNNKWVIIAVKFIATGKAVSVSINFNSDWNIAVSVTE